MHADTDLERLEKEAWRKFYDDGLFDIFLGLMLAMMPLGLLLDGWFPEPLSRMLALLVVYGSLVGAFTLLRHRFVKPRIGTIKPSKARRRKVNATRLALAISVLLGVIVLGVTVALRGTGNASFLNFIPLLFFANAVVVFSTMAYFLDVPRFHAYGPAFGLTGIVLILPRTLWGIEVPELLVFGMPALAIITVGAYKLVRFLREYPVRTDEVSLDGAR